MPQGCLPPIIATQLLHHPSVICLILLILHLGTMATIPRSPAVYTPVLKCTVHSSHEPQSFLVTETSLGSTTGKRTQLAGATLCSDSHQVYTSGATVNLSCSVQLWAMHVGVGACVLIDFLAASLLHGLVCSIPWNERQAWAFWCVRGLEEEEKICAKVNYRSNFEASDVVLLLLPSVVCLMVS